MNEFSQAIQTIAVYAIPVLFAISLHEAAHGYVAKYFGDPTAADAGRLSLNPAKHIDPFGTIVLPLLLYLTIHIPFGYAKPVPVDFGRLRNPKKQMAWVAFAGPAANFVMGIGWMILLVILNSMEGAEPFFLKMAAGGVSVNAVMFVFNLIPIPPLDGGRIMTGILPMSLARPYAQIERHSMYVFAALVVLMYFNLLGDLLSPVMQAVIGLMRLMVHPLVLLLS